MQEIIICSYNPEWKNLFKAEEELLKSCLDGEYKSIIHIGSTSIEGMDAKPIIDISIAVYELKDDSYYIDKLTQLGYSLSNGNKYQDWILLHRKSNGQDFHVHLMPHDSMRLLDQVLFKIFLEENPETAALYVLKKRYFAKYDESIWYSMNKKPFVEKICMDALYDIVVRKISFWKKRVEDIMGYVPRPEIFLGSHEESEITTKN